MRTGAHQLSISVSLAIEPCDAHWDAPVIRTAKPNAGDADALAGKRPTVAAIWSRSAQSAEREASLAVKDNSPVFATPGGKKMSRPQSIPSSSGLLCGLRRADSSE